MKKLLTSVLLISSLFGFSKVLSPQEVNDVLKASILYPRLAPEIKKGNIKVKGVYKDGFYVLKLILPGGSGYLYLTKDKKYTIIGKVINNKTGDVLKAPELVNKDIVKKGVVFTFGKGKKEIYLVTDPQCPFCRRLDKLAKKNLYKNYKVHVILMPLPFHKYAVPMSYWILSAKTDAQKAKRMEEVLSGGSEWEKFKPTQEEKKRLNKILQNSLNAAKELGAEGTPSVYDDNFKELDRSILIKGK